FSQRKVERDEALKVTEDLLQQAKKNQLHFQNLVKEAVTSAVENANIPNFNYINDLTKKVDDLSKKVENN
ncbi:MAG: hypothetical protein LBK69_06450, partial [Syntrophomonadaceae bacterium]|nr:hypothetical protein [Syntrophomonadaceae bacterium]